MCGVAGAFGPGAGAARIVAALRCMASRGRDHTAVWSRAGAALGYNRLAIRAPGRAGEQPLASEDGTVVAFGAGEVYDYAAHRAALERRGHRFAGGCDLEVLVHLYEEHGPGFARGVNGDFTLVLWDARRGRGVLARDPLGVKPLYYARAGRDLAFASELKGLAAMAPLGRPAAEAVLQYLLLNYPLAPGTFYEGALALPPGNTLVWEGGRVSLREYGGLRALAAAGAREAGEGGGGGGLAAVLADAVGVRLASDAPLGAHLSGGTDSSLLCHFAREWPRPLSTFTGAYEAEHDDLRYAGLVAARIGSRHHAVPVPPACVREHLPRLVACLDGPVMSPGALTPYMVARAAAERGVRVLLAGQGADEVFGGYARFGRAAHPGFTADGIFGVTANVDPATLRRYCTPRGAWLWSGADALRQRMADEFEGPPLLRMRLSYARHFLHELLRIEDHAHMHWTVENRVPYLDARVVAWGLARVSPEAAPAKRPLRELLAGRFASPAARRPGKSQMALPLERFRALFRPELEEALSDPALRLPGLDYPALLALARDGGPAPLQEMRLLWAVFNLHLWGRGLGGRVLEAP